MGTKIRHNEAGQPRENLPVIDMKHCADGVTISSKIFNNGLSY